MKLSTKTHIVIIKQYDKHFIEYQFPNIIGVHLKMMLIKQLNLN